MRERRMPGAVGLACLLLVAGPAPGTGRAIADSPVPVSGTISADNGHFIPIAQDGCVVTFLHPDVHELTGDIEGLMIEEGILVLDLCSGEGFFSVTADFVGTVLGSEPGTATLRVHGEIRDFFFIDRGHFLLTQGEGGLAGVHAWGSFESTVGHEDPVTHEHIEGGGSYNGFAHFDNRRE
jgi:hypothetical protein